VTAGTGINLRLCIVGKIVRSNAIGADDQVDLGGVEAGEFHREAEIEQFRQLAAQHRPIPAGQFGQAVIGDHIGAPLRLTEAADPQGRHFRQAQPPCRCQPGMPGQDPSGFIDQDRHREAELPHRLRQLVDLFIRVRPRIARVRA